ncbi:TIGR04076 family protein [Chloroflexota bacterium]
MQLPDIVIKVVSQEGHCEMGHKVGDEFVIKKGKMTQDLCVYAFSSIFPMASALLWGGSFPYEDDPIRTKAACPDPDNPCHFELRRVGKPPEKD